jgi:hypothetical protein
MSCSSRLAVSLALATALVALRAHGAVVTPTVTCASDTDSSAGGSVSWAGSPYGGAVLLSLPAPAINQLPPTPVAFACTEDDLTIVVARKSGEGPPEFGDIVVRPPAPPSPPPSPPPPPPKQRFQTGAVDGGWELLWDLWFELPVGDGVNDDTFTLTHFLGLRIVTEQPFAGVDDLTATFGPDGSFRLRLPQQDVVALVAVRSQPFSVPVPSTWGLALTGLAAAALGGRYRRRRALG